MTTDSGCPLLDDNRQWLSLSRGEAALCVLIPRAESLCPHVILSHAHFMVAS